MRISNGLAEIQLSSPTRGNRKVYLSPVYSETPVKKVEGLKHRKTPIEAPRPLFEKPVKQFKTSENRKKSTVEFTDSSIYTFNGGKKATHNFTAGLNFDSYA